jgi:hypothetical protein
MTLPPLPIPDEPRLISVRELSRRWQLDENDLLERIERGYLLCGVFVCEFWEFEFTANSEHSGKENYYGHGDWEDFICQLRALHDFPLELDAPLVLLPRLISSTDRVPLSAASVGFMNDAMEVGRPLSSQIGHKNYVFARGEVSSTLTQPEVVSDCFQVGVPREEVYRVEREQGIVAYGRSSFVDELGYFHDQPIRYSDYFPAISEVFLQELDVDLAPKARQELDAEVASKARNSYLRLISAMAGILLKGRTGSHYKDAEALLAVFASKSVECPVKRDTLARYLNESDKIS